MTAHVYVHVRDSITLKPISNAECIIWGGETQLVYSLTDTNGIADMYLLYSPATYDLSVGNYYLPNYPPIAKHPIDVPASGDITFNEYMGCNTPSCSFVIS